jgi:putative acetyltransferase
MITIRRISPDDNTAIAAIIRSTLAEFGANHPGTVYFDASTDALFDLFEVPKAVYYIAELDGEIVGGGGIYPTEGLPYLTCELVKMYLAPQARGKGLGRQLIQQSLDYAASAGYKQVYLESMPELAKALTIYEKFGFRYLSAPLGNSGHFGCERWMLKALPD